MRCPTLDELPAPPIGHVGWPWTEAPPHLTDRTPNGPGWPRVSIVTPSYHQAGFLEETIRSVLLQGYPNLEFIVIDGGSTDGSVDIIKKYEKWLTYWVSEPDRGQSHAINKGWKIARGEVLAYINSDDFYLPGAIPASVSHLLRHPECDLVYGCAHHVDQAGDAFGRASPPAFRLRRLLFECFIPQATVFLRGSLRDHIGLLDESLHYCMDYEYWLRAATVTAPGRTGCFTAAIRYHPDSKSMATWTHFWQEEIGVFDRMFRDGQLPAKSGLVRAAYLRRLLFLSARGNGLTGSERRDAAERLCRLQPRPSATEVTRAVLEFDAFRVSPYMRARQGQDDRRTATRGTDTYAVLPSLLEEGVVTREAAALAARHLSAFVSLQEMQEERGQPDDARRKMLLRIARQDARLLSRRSWWSLFLRSVPVGSNVMGRYDVLRGRLAS